LEITFPTHISSRRGIASNASFNGAYSSALNLDPLTPLYEENESRLSQAPYATEPVVTDDRGRTYGISNFVGAEIVNPLALLETQRAQTRVDKVVGNIFGELELLEGLKFRSSAGIDLAYIVNDNHTPLFYLNGAQNNTEKTNVSKNIQRYNTWDWENTLIILYKQVDTICRFLGVCRPGKPTSKILSGFNADVPVTDPRHVYLNMATDTVWTAFGGAWHYALLSQFGRILYDYEGRYAFNFTMRRDGSSNFGANNRFGYFPSVGCNLDHQRRRVLPCNWDALDI
jgi:TonB-dependent starch-binding outer membrane protein SusC